MGGHRRTGCTRGRIVLVVWLSASLAPVTWAATTRAAARERIDARARDTLGTAEHPIEVDSTRVSALRVRALDTMGAVARAPRVFGVVLAGVPAATLATESFGRVRFDARWDAGADVYSGAAAQWWLHGSDGVFVDGGRVLLRDPRTVLERGGSDSEYWTTSAGVEVRF